MAQNSFDPPLEKNYVVKTFGLNPYEQGIIYEQLRILHGRTNINWHYNGEGLDAHLVLSKAKVEICPWGLLAVMASNPTNPNDSSYLHCEWPLRIIGLLDLLRNAEGKLTGHPKKLHHIQDLKKESPKISTSVNNHHDNSDFLLPESTQSSHSQVSDQLANKAHQLGQDQYFEFQVNHHEAAIALGHNNRITVYSDSSSSELLSSLLDSPKSLRVTELLLSSTRDNIFIFAHVFPIEQLLWELAWKESVPNITQWNNDTVFRIHQWPRLGQWYTEPSMFQLSALYGKKFASLQNGVQLSGLPDSQVAAFLHACAVTRLGLISKKSSPTNTVVTATDPHTNPFTHKTAHTNLLINLRKKLGLVFHI